MCYKAPGPRCKNYYDKELLKSEKKAESYTVARNHARTRLYAMQRSVDPKQGEAEYNDSLAAVENAKKDLKNITSDMADQYEKIGQIREKRNATRGGIALLQEKSQNATNPEAKKFASIELERAQAAFQTQLRDYDKLYGTVEGQKPAKDFSEWGVSQTKKEANRLENKQFHKAQEYEKHVALAKKFPEGSEEYERHKNDALGSKKQLNSIRENLARKNRLYYKQQTTRKNVYDGHYVPTDMTSDDWKAEADSMRGKGNKTTEIETAEKYSKLARNNYTAPAQVASDGKSTFTLIHNSSGQRVWSNGTEEYPIHHDRPLSSLERASIGEKKLPIKMVNAPAKVSHRMNYETFDMDVEVVPDVNPDRRKKK